MRTLYSSSYKASLRILVTFVVLFFTSHGLTKPSTIDLGITDADITQIEKIVNATVPFGENKGMPLNTSVRRPLYVIGAGPGDSDALSDKLNEETVTIANYFHKGEFYIARIPVSKVNSVVLLEAPFMNKKIPGISKEINVASHTMLRFVTDDDAPVELVAKIKNRPNVRHDDIKVEIETLETPIAVKDMVISIDGTEPLGLGRWNLKHAIEGKYTITYRMVSVAERLHWFIVADGTPIKQSKWKVSALEARKTLRRSIKESHVIGYSSPYRLLRANCTNLAIRLVKDSNPYSQRNSGLFGQITQRLKSFADFVIRATEPITLFTQFNLRSLGWIEKRGIDLQDMPEFKEEMEGAVVDFRNSILNRTDLDNEQKLELIKKLGVDETMPVIKDPKRFHEVIQVYKNALMAQQEKERQSTKRAQCYQFYK